MADWYVSPTGDDTTGDGSSGNPYQHIHKAIDEAGDNDTIKCYPGNYFEEVGRHAVVRLTIESLSGDYSDTVVKLYTFASAYAGITSLWCNVYAVKNISFILDNSFVTNWNDAGYNTVLHTYASSLSSDVIVAVVVDCYFISECTSGNYGNAIVSNLYGGILCYKNTFRNFNVGSTWSGVNMAVNNSKSAVTVSDCIFDNNYNGIRRSGASTTVTENYNSFYGNTSNSPAALGANSITSDPLFIDATNARISADSPCIDAGIAVTSYVDSYSGNAPDIGCYELPGSILIYTGTWNNGSNSGTNYLGSSVISIGRISEVLLGGVNRPWCQQTTVVLDDSDSSFIGTLAKGTDWYNGTFNIWANDGTSWEQLMTGFVPAASWSYDYSQKTATLQVNSMLKRAASISMGFGSSTGDSLSTFTAAGNFSTLLGTITAIDSGTVTFTQYGAQPVHPILNTYIWQYSAAGGLDTSNQGAARLASFQGWTEGDSGTWSLACQFSGGTASWMSVGAIAGRTIPYPSAQSLNAGVTDGYSGIDMFFYQAGTHMGLTWDATNWTKFTADLSIVPLACEPMVGTQMYSTVYPFGDLPAASVGTAPLYYGGGLWFECMTDLMNSVGANWTVDGNGVIRAKIKRAAALEAVTGTVQFTDAEDNLTASWTFSSTEGPALVMVEHEWNNYDERLTGTAMSTGSMNTGDTMTHQAKWQRGIGGALLAERLMKWEQRIGRIFALSYPVSFWGSFVPGSLVALENIPNALNPDYNASGSTALLTAGKYVVQARHYDYMDYRVIAELRQVPPLTGVFILDISELDGPDKLY